MATTIAQLIDRIYRDYLTPPNEQPAQAPLAAGINNSVTTVTLTAGHLSQVELDALGAGSIIECGQELFRILTYSAGSPVTLTVATRGTVLGTAAATHTAGDSVILRPNPPRKTVFDGACDAIENLFPALGLVKSETTTTPTPGNWLEIATDVEEVLDLRYAVYETGSSVSRYEEAGVELLPYPFPPATTSGKAIQIDDWIPSGRTAYLRYLARFVRPTAESDDFDDVGLDEAWGSLVIFGTLLRVLPVTDLSARQAQYITRAIELAGYPVGSGRTLAQTIIQVYEYLLGQARVAFRNRYPMRTTWAVI